MEYSNQLNNALTYSTQEAERLGNTYVGPEHLLLGLIRLGAGKALEIINTLRVDVTKVKNEIEILVRTDNNSVVEEIPLLKSTEKLKKIMELEARSLSVELADTEHLLLAILKMKNNLADDILTANNISYERVLEQISTKNRLLMMMTTMKVKIRLQKNRNKPQHRQNKVIRQL